MNEMNILWENAYLKGRVISLEAQLESERAEVARLLSENALVREESDRHYGLWVERGYQLAKLRKAGTEMGKHLPDTDAANRAYIDFEAEAGE